MPRSPYARPPPSRARPLRRAGLALAASAALNAGALAGLAAAGAFALPAQAPAPVALAALTPEAWAANRRLLDGRAAVDGERVAASKVPLAAPAPSRPPEAPSLPIVSVAPSQDSRRPAAARFLAERDNTVPRDTQVRGALPETRGSVASRPSGGAAGADGIPLPGEEGSADEHVPGREGAPRAEDPGARVAAARRALSGGAAPAPAPDAVGAASAAGAGEGGARRSGRFDPRLLPTGARFAALGAGGPMPERLAGVADGDATMLNTRAYRYAEFYRRVGEAIRTEWDPNRAWDERDPGEVVYGRLDRRVVVEIVLDEEGRLVEVKVARSSGLDFFDRETVRAISAAAPFPNPPRGLLGPDGRVVLADYGLRFRFPERVLLERLPTRAAAAPPRDAPAP